MTRRLRDPDSPPTLGRNAAHGHFHDLPYRSCARTSASRRFTSTARPTSEKQRRRADRDRRSCAAGSASARSRSRPSPTCPECDGPLDVGYDLAARARARDARSARCGATRRSCRTRRSTRGSPGMTPLVPARRLSNALGIELLLKLESANPTHSFKDRLAATAVAAAEAFGLQTLCCGSTGNLGEAVAARAAASRARGGRARARRGSRGGARPPPTARGCFAVAGTFEDCLRLERELASLFPWGFVGGNLHAVAAEGAKTIAYEIVEQLGGVTPDAVVAPVASGTLFAKLAQGFDEAACVGLERRAAPAAYRRAGGRLPAARGGVGRRPAALAGSPADGGALAGDRRPGLRRAGRRRRAHVGRRDPRRPEHEIADRTALLAETTGILADSAGGVALGALHRRDPAGHDRRGRAGRARRHRDAASSRTTSWSSATRPRSSATSTRCWRRSVSRLTRSLGLTAGLSPP